MNTVKKALVLIALNGGMLILIPNLFNLLLFKYLPSSYSMESFTKGISQNILTLENIGRLGVFALPFFLRINFKNSKFGLAIYIVGLLIYFSTWFAQIIFPESIWSRSLIGFIAPAITPILWLIGCSLLFKEFYFRSIKYHPIIYIVMSLFFITFHVIHTTIVNFNK